MLIESFQRYFTKNKVRDYLRTNSYIVHGVDDLETLQNILATGLRPRTQISNSEGQGLDSGPYILVYPTKAKKGGHEVDYRVGDYLGATVKGKPVLILFDVGALMDLPPIETLETRFEQAFNQRLEYAKQKYPTSIVLDQRPDSRGEKVDWKILGDLGGYQDQSFKRLDRIVDNASREYFDALDKENYKAKDAADYLKELQAIVAPYKIPIKQMDYDTNTDDFVFVRYTP